MATMRRGGMGRGGAGRGMRGACGGVRQYDGRGPRYGNHGTSRQPAGRGGGGMARRLARIK